MNFNYIFFFFIFHQFNQFRDILNYSTVRGFHLSQKFLLIITGNVKNATKTLDQTYAVLWKNGLVNSQVLIEDDTKSWSFFTFMPYQTDCYILSHRKIESFTLFNYTTNMSVLTDELFPKKLNNFNNCPLYYAPSFVAPFAILHNVSDENIHVEGIDIFIIQEIAKLLRFSIVYKIDLQGTGHGMVFDNGTVTGNLGVVSNFQSNLLQLNCLCFIFCSTLFVLVVTVCHCRF